MAFTTLFVDPSATVNGTGSREAPFNRVNNALNVAVHPFAILIKRGTTVRNDDYINDTTSKLKNLSGQMSYIGAYGDVGRITGLNKSSNRPVWPMNGLYNPQIQTNETCWLQVQDLWFQNQTRVVNTGLGTRNIMINVTSDANDIANVHIAQCLFTGDSRSNSLQTGGNQRVCLFVNSTTKKRAHKITVQRSQFDHVGSGVYIRGNTIVDDITDNRDDQYKSYGCYVVDCEFTALVNCAVLLHTVASQGTRFDRSNDMWSGYDRCSYTSHRWDKNGADAAFWCWHSNRVGGQYLYVDGMQAMSQDGMAFDIDGQCWDCGFRYCYTQNNVSCAMFVSGGNAGGVVWDPQAYSYREWYLNRRMGSGGNLFEYIFSFNDAIQRLRVVPAGLDIGSEIHAAWLRNSKCQFNNTVRNCTIIDTVSVKRKLLINSNVYNTFDDTQPALTWQNNLFYARHLTDSNLFNHVKYTNDATGNYVDIAPPVQMVVNNNIIFSSVWAGGTVPDLTKFASKGNIFSEPWFVNLRESAPSGFQAAKNVKLVLGLSPAFGRGIQSTTPDINGKLGNNIGWLQ